MIHAANPASGVRFEQTHVNRGVLFGSDCVVGYIFDVNAYEI